VLAVTTWFRNGCTVVGLGSYVVNQAPKQGSVSFSDENLPIPGCSNGPQPAAVAYYTWTSKTPGVTTDFFQLTYSDDGQSEVIDITVDLIPGGKILFNGIDVTDASPLVPVYIGQQIPLTVDLPQGTTPASNTPWVVDGIIVGGFVTTPPGNTPTCGQTQSATYSPQTVCGVTQSASYSSTAATFYWIAAGTYPVS
jgi:hypothetical protein